MCVCSFFRDVEEPNEEGEEGAAQVSARLVHRMCWCIKEPFRFESPPPSHSHARALSQGSTSFSMGSCYGTLAVANQELLTAHGQRISKEDLLDLMEANFLLNQYLTKCEDFTYITMDDMEAAVKAFLSTHPGICRAILVGSTALITPKSSTTLWYVRKLGGKLFRPYVILQNENNYLYGLPSKDMGTQPSELPALTASGDTVAVPACGCLHSAIANMPDRGEAHVFMTCDYGNWFKEGADPDLDMLQVVNEARKAFTAKDVKELCERTRAAGNPRTGIIRATLDVVKNWKLTDEVKGLPASTAAKTEALVSAMSSLTPNLGERDSFTIVHARLNLYLNCAEEPASGASTAAAKGALSWHLDSTVADNRMVVSLLSQENFVTVSADAPWG